MHLALGFLQTAGDKGSPAALEDMAEIYRDGIGVPANVARAEAYLKQAEQLRKAQGR